MTCYLLFIAIVISPLLSGLHVKTKKSRNYKVNPSYLKQDPREELIQAWYMDDSDEDQRLPHHTNPQQFVSFDKLDGIQSLHFPTV